MDYLVSPPEATDWRMEADAFAGALHERWPTAEVRPNPDADPTYAFDLSVTRDGRRVDGGFGRAGQLLGLVGDLADVLQVAPWFREVVPPEQPLLFYDPALNGQVELVLGTSTQETGDAYLADAAQDS